VDSFVVAVEVYGKENEQGGDEGEMRRREQNTRYSSLFLQQFLPLLLLSFVSIPGAAFSSLNILCFSVILLLQTVVGRQNGIN
jgi:hypothetical protein